MKVRLPLIWTEYEQLDEDELTSYNALGKEPEAIKEEGSVVIEINEVCTWFKDKENTIIDLKNGKRYQLSITEPEFSTLYTELTKEVIVEVVIETEIETEDDGTN